MSAPSSGHHRPRGRLILLGLVVVAASVGGFFWWRTQQIHLPAHQVNDLDPEVRDAILSAQADLKKNRDSASSWAKVGMVLFAHEFNAESLFYFRKAEELDPAEPRWPYFQGLVLFLEDRPACIEPLQRAVERAGRDIIPRLRLAEVLLEFDRLDEAEAMYRQVVQYEMPKENPRAILGLGLTAYRRGDLAKSIDFLKRVTEEPTTRRTSRNTLAEIYLRQGKTQEAEVLRSRGLEVKAEVPWPDRWLAEVEQLQTGVTLRVARAERIYNQGLVDNAIQLLTQVLKDHPASEEGLLTLGRIMVNQGAPDHAEGLLREVLKIAPKTVDAHFQLGLVRVLQQDFAAAELSFRRTVELQPNHARAHFNIGQCRLRDQDDEGALASFQTSLRYSPDLVQVHLATAELLAKKGRKAEALTHAKNAVQLAPNNKLATDLLDRLK